MEPEYIVAFLAVFLTGIAIGRFWGRTTPADTAPASVAPYRRAKPKIGFTTPPIIPQRDRGDVLSPVPDLPVFTKPAPRQKWFSKKSAKGAGSPTDKLSAEDRALLVSLIRRGQMGDAKRVLKQILNLKEPALSVEFKAFSEKAQKNAFRIKA